MNTGKIGLVAAAAALALTSGAAAAQEHAVRVSHAAIASGDLASAERMLLNERKIYGARPEVLLNLAAVYARSGRGVEASALYREVLAQDDVTMDLSGGRTASAHAIARVGLSRLQPMIATR